MPIKNYITDGTGSGLRAKVDNADGTEENALVVATRALTPLDKKILFFTNEDYGLQMAEDFSASGSEEGIHNGLDTVEWTTSVITGSAARWDFESTNQNHTSGGAKSIDGRATINNDKIQFTKVAGTINLTTYNGLSGWIYLTSIFGGFDVIAFRPRLGGTNISAWIDINAYINTTLTNVWQKFTIPKGDMGLSTQEMDGIRLDIEDTPNFYLDDFQIDAIGTGVGSQEFTVAPGKEEWYEVKALNFTFVDELDTTDATNNMSMYNLSFDQILGMASLDNGIGYKRYKDGVVEDSLIFRDLRDMLQFGGAEIITAMCDGTHTMVKVRIPFESPLILKSEEQAYLSILLSDDFSQLLDFKVSCEATVESRS